MALIDLANPTRFLAFVTRALPWLVATTVLLLTTGLYLAALAPDDYQQGATVKIMFIHVPNAWLSMFVWGVMTVASLGTLVWRHPLADVAAKAAAPLGASFTFLALVTGSLWGRPMWGTYWEWDARLTSVLLLFLMYLGLIALWRAVEDPSRAGRAAAMLTLVGAINIPIIKFSVNWWNTIHQGASVVRAGGPSMDHAFLIPLLIMAAGFSALFVTLHLAAMRNEILRRRVRSLQMMQASRQNSTNDTDAFPRKQMAPGTGARCRHDAWPLRLFHRDVLRACRRNSVELDRLDCIRLPEPEGPIARSRSQRHRPALERYDRAPMIVATETPRARRWLFALPLVVFAVIALLFLVRLHGGDSSRLPSALIGRPVPQTALPALPNLQRDGVQVPGLHPFDFKGNVSVVNVWASWCVPCREEAPLLNELGKDKRLQLIGINYKDSSDSALRFLGGHGNPFHIVGADRNGRAAIEWGVYGVPETFIVGRDGNIVYKLVGPVTPENFERVLKVQIEQALN